MVCAPKDELRLLRKRCKWTSKFCCGSAVSFRNTSCDMKVQNTKSNAENVERYLPQLALFARTGELFVGRPAKSSIFRNNYTDFLHACPLRVRH
jgi:hypothetical protein